MNDTHPKIAAIYSQMLAERTPTERMEGTFSLLFSAQELARAGIRHEAPHLSALELECALFERFYGRDLHQKIRTEFIAQLKLRFK